MDADDGDRKLLHRHRFGSAEFDEARFELRVGGLVVEAQHKPLQLLALLLRQPGEVVDKDAIVEALWGGRATPDQVIATTASRLRTALGEGNAQRVVTVPRRGYRIEPPVERLAVGRRMVSALRLEPGAPVPGRESYRLLRQLGRSGGHETWLARHPRTADLRVFKFAVDGERLADIKREVTLYRVLQQSLGERADIARVVDWRFEEPPFWIECEYGGDSLLEWALQPAGDGGTRLAATPAPERIALLRLAAQAVAAAHAVGVLHKDLKPANLLVEESAAGRIVRLTDFGSGRLLDPDRLDALQITRLGMTVASDDSSSGTPFYMAPELGRGEPATAASDVYALGVMLYQLLAGDLKRLMAPGWERDIGDELLVQDIASATDLEPQRRLGSAAELAQRLAMLPERRERHAAALAEAARAQAHAQALARARARRPWAIAAMLALALGTATSLWLYVGQRRANEALARQNAVADALNRLLREDLIGAASPARNGRADVTVADALAGAASRIDERFAGSEPAVRGSLHAAMQGALSDLSRVKESAVEGRRALEELVRAGAGPGELQPVRLRLALDLVQLSKLDEARGLVKAIDAAAIDAPQDGNFRARLLYVKSWLVGGELAVKESTRLLEQAMQVAEADPGVEAQLRRVTAFALADSYAMEGRLAEAEHAFRALMAEQAKAFGAEDSRTLFTGVGLGRALGRMGRIDEARALLQRSADGLAAKLGPNHRQALDARDQLAQLRYLEKDWAGAARDWARVHEGFVALLGAGASQTLTVQTNVALARHRGGDPAAAAGLLRDALARARAFLKDDAPQVQQLRFALAEALVDLRRSAEARPLLEGLDPAALNDAQPENDWPDRLRTLTARVAR